jgi:hypothetical protein
MRRLSSALRKGIAYKASVALLFFLASCAPGIPDNPDNACDIFKEKRSWYLSSFDIEKKYGVPMQVQLAIIRQESSYVHDAKTPRKTFLGIPLWWRQSTAYGYVQALDGTWRDFQNATGDRSARRDNYDDSVKFLGWYNNISFNRLKIRKNDAYNLYLAYHEGHGGWKRKTYLKKKWLMKVAKKVQRNSLIYGKQLSRCRKSLKSSWWAFWE